MSLDRFLQERAAEGWRITIEPRTVITYMSGGFVIGSYRVDVSHVIHDDRFTSEGETVDAALRSLAPKLRTAANAWEL